MLSIKNLSVVFNEKSSNEIVALKNINLQIKPEEFVVIVGTNGSGKSTLLNAIAGQIIPSNGSIYWNDKDITRLKEHQRSRWVTRVFQNPLAGTAPELSVIDNFRLAAIRTQSKNLRIGINSAFEKSVKEKIAILNLGLENKIHQPIGMLSGGQRQALTLLMSIMDESKLLLLDEPTAALDPRSAQTVLQLADKIIRQYHLTAIFITHNMKDALSYGNRLVQLSEGEIIRDIRDDEKEQLYIANVVEWF